MDLLIDTQKLDEEFAKKLHLKTGKPMEIIDEAIGLIKKDRILTRT
jgi:spore coat polysaccharide biosynthesis predicted glycosyltransferase SpsG